MNAHTPGPWIAVELLSGSENHRGWRIAAGHKSHFPVGEVYPLTSDGSPSAKANAELIAAAPDLLYVLRTMVGALPAKRDWLDPDVEKIARGIIAKAEGESA